MNFSEEEIEAYFERIDQLHPGLAPKFGQMNVHQMVSHCADFFRMAKGTIRAEEYGVVDVEEVMRLVRARKTAPTPKGFGQLEGGGTKPTNLEDDKEILRECIRDFAHLDDSFEFAEHPFFGMMSNEEWVDLAHYHLNHHLKQFRV